MLMQQQDRAEWLEQRRSGIGGSDVPAICGFDDFGRTAADVYDEKLGLVPDREPTPAMQRGAYLEPLAADLYAARTRRNIRRQPMRRHAQMPWMIVNVDRQILRAGEVGETGVLEIKCPGIRQFARIKAHGLPDRNVLQLQHYLAVLGYSWGSFAIFSAEQWELVWFDLERDDTLIDRLVEIEHDFWHNHVLAGVRPEPEPVELPKLPEVSGTVVTREDPEWAEAIAMLAEAKELTATAKDLEDAAKERIQALAGGYGVFEGAGARIYWREMPGRKSVDKAALQRAHPEIDLSAYEKPGKPYAEFRTYFLRGDGDDA